MQWLKKLFGLFTLSWLPPAHRWKIIYWTIHVLVVVLIVVALGWLNVRGGLDRVLRTRWMNLNLVWLPLLFLLGYAMFWLIRWLYWLLGPDGVAGQFEDVESAWNSARAALDEAGVSLQETPVFLVLGKTSSTMEDVFASARVPLLVRHAPEGDAPLRVFANREAVFVTCEGASLIAEQIDRLLEFEQSASAIADSTPLHEYLETGEMVEPQIEPTELAPKPSHAGSVLLLGEEEPEPGQIRKPRRESLLSDREKVELAGKRLEHTCNLLVRDRKPYCPINGILVLLPLVVTDSADDASETAQVLRHDLETARGALQMDCARLVVLGDAEKLPGFAEVVRHFPQSGDGPSWVLGQHYPLLPDLPDDKIPSMIEGGIAWVGDAMLPLVVGQLWRREGEEGVGDRAGAIEANVRLYEFLHSCRQRLALLGRLAARAVQSDEVPPYLAGCYLAGTGADAESEQGFLAGVIRRCLDEQNHVRWTGDALADDAAYRWYVFVGYVLLVAFVVALAFTLIAWW